MSDFRKFTLRERLEKFPPFLVIALCRVRNPPMTKEELRQRHWNRGSMEERSRRLRLGIPTTRRSTWRRITYEEIQERSKLSLWWIKKISKSVSWDEVPTGKMLAYLDACGINVLHTNHKRAFIRSALKTNTLFSSLSKQHMKMFNSLMQKRQTKAGAA